MNTKTIRFLKNLSTGLVIVAMIFAFLIAGIRIFGVQVYGVLTGSMEPTHPTGSLIYVKRTDASDLRVNDVITFSISPNVIATHRIVEIVPDETNPSIVRYRTKGDANKDVDASLVSASNIIGKVMFSIPQLGYIANFIQQPPGIYVAILVCGLTIAFVFYTDSLENKQKASFRRSGKRNYNAPQKRPQTGRMAQQRPASRQGQYPRQGDYRRPGGYPRQNSYSRQGEYPRQGRYSNQGEYRHGNEYPRQSGYSHQNGYPQQRTNSPRREEPRQRAYSKPRDGRTGRM